MSSANGTLIFVAITMGLLAHLVLLVLSRRIAPAFLVASTFMILAPLSRALDLSSLGLIKYGRIYCSILLVLLGVLSLRKRRLGSASFAFLGFGAFYVLAGLWSGNIAYALGYKGLFFINAAAGVLLSQRIRSQSDFTTCLRCLILAAVSFVLLIMLNFILNPSAISHVGRLTVYGMNPNTIGETSAVLFIVAFSISLYDPARIWKWVGYLNTALLIPIVAYTGSRASAGLGAVGAIYLIRPFVNRPGTLFSISGVVGVAGLLLFKTLDQRFETERFVQFDGATREMWWRNAIDKFLESPLIGKGWIYLEGWGVSTTESVLSAWLQVLVETGLVGASVFLGAGLVIIVQSIRAGFVTKRNQQLRPMMGFAGATIIALVAHSFFESSLLLGSTMHPLLFGLAVGLLDRVTSSDLRESKNNSDLTPQNESGWILENEPTPLSEAFQPNGSELAKTAQKTQSLRASWGRLRTS